MVDRRRRKEPMRNQMCLRLKDRQLGLLQRYVDLKGYASEAEAIRNMIDGLEDWLARQEARNSSRGDSGPSPEIDQSINNNDAPATDVKTIDVGEEPSTSVGDFGGRPAVGLPGTGLESDSE